MIMKSRWNRIAVMLLFGVGASSFGGDDSPDHAVPSGLDLIKKMIERAEAREQENSPEAFAYRLVTVREELDRHGDTEERIEFVYQVMVSGGKNERRLLLVNGKPPSEERVQEERKEARDRNGAARHPTSGTQSIKVLTEDLTRKLEFHYEKTERVDGRPCYLVNFKPAADPPPTDSFMDRIFAHIYGNIWIDAEDFEMARLQVRLGEPVRLWGGFLASLKTLDISLIRQRSEEGIWYLQFSRTLILGRALIHPFRLRVTEGASDFKKMDHAPVADQNDQTED